MHIGDKVRFRRQKGEGVILRLLSNKKAEVLMDNDFEIIMDLMELVPIAREERIVFGQAEEDKPTKKVKPKVFSETGIFLTISEKNNGFHALHLANNTDFIMGCSAKRVERSTVEALNLFTLQPKTATEMYRIPGANIAELCFELDFIFLDTTGKFDKKPIRKEWKLTPKKMLGKKESLPIVGEKGFLFQLDKTEKSTLEKPEPVSQSTNAGIALVNLKKPSNELDLHIEVLAPHMAAESSNLIVQTQMNAFENHFHNCRSAGLPKATYIHGIGKQKLKRQIEKWLLRNKHLYKEISEDQNGAFGGGAITVYFT